MYVVDVSLVQVRAAMSSEARGAELAARREAATAADPRQSFGFRLGGGGGGGGGEDPATPRGNLMAKSDSMKAGFHTQTPRLNSIIAPVCFAAAALPGRRC